MAFLLQIRRNLMTTSCITAKGLTKRANPGLGHQVSAIDDAVNIIQSDPEGFEGLESDLYNAHQSHKKHELNLQYQKEDIRLHIVKRKYFRKDPVPNLLTYAEKDQIRFLHSSDDEEWTVDKLADSFPASVETIRLILKSRWSPMSPKRIRSHDANVLENWERLKNGEYSESIPPDLSEHFKKYAAGRTSSKILEDSTQFRKKLWNKPNSNEFSSIISLLNSKNIDNTAETKKLLKAKPKIKEIGSDSIGCETYIVEEIKDKTPITIHRLKNKHFVQNNESMTYNENLTFDKEENHNIRGTGTLAIKDKSSSSSGINIDYSEKFATNEIIVSDADRKRYEMSSTKQRIHIPRKLWRKGATYCSNSCYYDDDGEFLYKVLL